MDSNGSSSTVSSDSSTVSPSLSTVSPDRPLLALLDESPALIILAFLCALVAIGTNSFLIGLIISSPKLRKMQVNCYIALLALADLIIGISIPMRPAYILYAMSRQLSTYPKMICSLVNILKAFGFTMTRIVVLTIALDRLYVVIRPLAYKGRFNPILFFFVAFLSFAVPAFDVSLKYVAMTDLWAPVSICSLTLSRGPYSETFAAPFTYACLALLIVIYLPFLVVYLGRDKFSQKQIRITAGVIWLILFYLFHWGFSYAVDLAKSSLVALLGEQFLANTGSNPGVYSSYLMGWVGNLSSTAAFFNYIWKHDELRKRSAEIWQKWTKNAPKIGSTAQASNQVIQLNVNSQLEKLNRTRATLTY